MEILWFRVRGKDDLAQKEGISGFWFDEGRDKTCSCCCFGKAGPSLGWWALLVLPFPRRGSGATSQRSERLMVLLNVLEQEQLLCRLEVSSSLCTSCPPVVCHGLTPDGNSAPHSHLLCGEGERIQRVKVRKFVGWYKYSLMDKAKLCMQARQNKEFIQQFPGAGGCLATPRNWRNGWTYDCYWGRQMLSLQIFCSPFLFPEIYVPSMKPFDMEHPLGQLGSAVLAMSWLLNSLCIPSLLTGGAE